MAKTTSMASTFGLALLALAAATSSAGQGATSDRFEMLYEELAPEQQALVDDWIARYSEVTGESFDSEVYNELPLSVKTTFAAVTHALTRTPLTDEDGEPFMSEEEEPRPLTALDLIAKLDTVRGRVKGAPGDEQFRIYVQLIPGGVGLLEDSQEFSRGRDNTVYHKGYPQNFRSSSGVPSIQFSVAVDDRLADIDVDYRSSKFPAALLNGHLTSGNSDVRAGNNYNRHIGHWEGLDNWWSGWEGLGDWFSALYGARGLDIPKDSPQGNGPLADAVYDFLHSWLVEERPDVAMSYFSPRIYRCFEGADDEVNPDAPVEQRMYRKMTETVRVIGNPRRLHDAAQGVRITSLGLRTLEDNPHHETFVLYDVPPARAMEFECGFRNLSIPLARRAQLRRSGDYALGTFYLKTGEIRGVTAAVLWSRESDGWKLVSFELEPAEGTVPDLHVPPQVPRARGLSDLEADPEVLLASERFVTAWFADRDVETAMSYVSPQSFACLDAFSDPSDPSSAAAASDPRTRFAEALESVSEFVGDIDGDSLAEAIDRVEPWSPRFQDVTPAESPVTLIALPDDEAARYHCPTETGEETSPRRPGAPDYGNFYGTTFRLKLAGGEHPATFLVLWGREESSWKVVAFEVVAS